MLKISYHKITDEDREKAQRIDLADFLRSQGEKVTKVGREYVWQDGAEKISINGNVWFNHYEQEGGNAISFVQKYFNKDYYDAIDFLLGGTTATINHSNTVPKDKPKGIFELPKPNYNNDRVRKYLIEERGLSEEIVDDFIDRGLIYESKQHHNAVFVGIDLNGNPKHAHMRGTGPNNQFKGNSAYCEPEYSFHYHGTSPFLFMFEAPIDMLSFMSMYLPDEWDQHSYVAACSVSERPLLQMIRDNPNFTCVMLALDNDEPGQKATHRILDDLKKAGIETRILIPEHKDWNEDLIAKLDPVQAGVPCQAYQS